MNENTIGETYLARAEFGEELWPELEMPCCWEAEVTTGDGRKLYAGFAAGPHKVNGLDVSEISCARGEKSGLHSDIISAIIRGHEQRNHKKAGLLHDR